MPCERLSLSLCERFYHSFHPLILFLHVIFMKLFSCARHGDSPGAKDENKSCGSCAQGVHSVAASHIMTGVMCPCDYGVSRDRTAMGLVGKKTYKDKWHLRGDHKRQRVRGFQAGGIAHTGEEGAWCIEGKWQQLSTRMEMCVVRAGSGEKW